MDISGRRSAYSIAHRDGRQRAERLAGRKQFQRLKLLRRQQHERALHDRAFQHERRNVRQRLGKRSRLEQRDQLRDLFRRRFFLDPGLVRDCKRIWLVQRHERFHARHIEWAIAKGLEPAEADDRVVKALKKIPEGRELLVAAEILDWYPAGQEILARAEQVARACAPILDKKRAAECGQIRGGFRDELFNTSMEQYESGIRGAVIKQDAMDRLVDRLWKSYGGSALNFYTMAATKPARKKK